MRGLDMATDRINSIQDLNTHCLAEFRKHWECLDDRNHQLWQCRPAEWKLNKCVFDNLVCHILGRPAHGYPVYMLTPALAETREEGSRPAHQRHPRPPSTKADLCRRAHRPWRRQALYPGAGGGEAIRELEALKDRDSIMYICRMNESQSRTTNC